MSALRESNLNRTTPHMSKINDLENADTMQQCATLPLNLCERSAAPAAAIGDTNPLERY